MRKARSTVVRAVGHPAIRATHSKTLELTREREVTQRSTCVAGVEAEFDAAELGLLRGPVALTLSTPGGSASGTAVVNPDHEVGERLVVRRSRHRDADTLAVDATLTAADLGRELVAELSDPGGRVTLHVAELEPPAPLVLVGPARPAGRLGSLWEAADAVVDLDGGRGLAGGLAALTPGGVVAASLTAPLDEVVEAAANWLVEAARRGARLWLPGAGPAETALLASGLPVTPSLRLGHVDRRAVRGREVIRRFGSPLPVVFTVPVAEAEAVLRPVAALSPRRRMALPGEELDVGTAMRWTTAEAAVGALRNRDAETVVAVLGPADQDASSGDLDEVTRALLDAGVHPRTLGEALRPFGVTRRHLYAMIQDQRADADGEADREGDDRQA
ncbi:DUF371 domain-containing protein [Streptomyces sp. B6B3]|uniref:DUF371 domain-containing protein n=1 Tax=Streptomyces sp. B6B3 TaxID=3153570 RepID=UPI00325C6653